MNFFEKAQARAHALEVLGLAGHPQPEEVRSAYRKLAFERHPDRGAGTDEEFARINAAYSFLKKDQGYADSDRLRPAPTDTGATTFRGGPDASGGVGASDKDEDSDHSGVSLRRVRTGMTSRIVALDATEAERCRSLLDEIPFMAEAEPDEMSLRANIVGAIRETDAPFVPHSNHLPYAVRRTGRRVSYMVRDTIQEGVNRVAVPTGIFSDNRKVLPVIVRFKAERQGPGTHVVSAATLAESFAGAKSVRVHFGLGQWPAHADEADSDST